jgi:DNA-directed RNA polymerase omega subunit
MAENEPTARPDYERMVDVAGSKFALVHLLSRRARVIQDYMRGELHSGIIPPQVECDIYSKPLSIAMSEVSSGKIVSVPQVYETLPEEDIEAG